MSKYRCKCGHCKYLHTGEYGKGSIPCLGVGNPCLCLEYDNK